MTIDPDIASASAVLATGSSAARAAAARRLGDFDPGPDAWQDTELRGLTTGALIAAFDADDDASVRSEAGIALARYSDPKAFYAIKMFLLEPADSPLAVAIAEGVLVESDVHPTIAGIAMGIVGMSARVPDDLLRLLRSGGPAVAGTAGSALLNHPEASVDDVVAVMREAPATVAAQAAAALGRRQDGAAVTPLIAALTATETEVREAAAAALASIGSSVAIGPLVRAVLAESTMRVWPWAGPGTDPEADDPAWTLDRWAHARKRRRLRDPPSEFGLQPAYADAFVIALSAFGPPAVTALLAALGRTPAPPARVLGRAVAVCRLVGRPGAPLLQAGLADEREHVRWVAAAGIGAGAELDAVEPLVAIAASSRADVRATALVALGRIARAHRGVERAALARLFAALVDEAPPVRQVARAELLALAERTPAVVEAATRLLDERPEIAAPALKALADLPGALDALASAARVGAPDSRIRALVVIREIAGAGRPPSSLLDHAGLEDAVTEPASDADQRERRVAAEAAEALRRAREARDTRQERRRAAQEEWRQAHQRRDPRVREQRVYRAAVPPKLIRYTDVQLHSDEHSPRPLPDDEPLVAGVWVRLEVAVRHVWRGLSYTGRERSSLPGLRSDTDGVVRMLVAADSDDFDIDDRLGQIELPAAADSRENAWFRIRPRRAAPSSAPLQLELRLYRDWNLVEVLILEAAARPRLDPSDEPPAPSVWLRRPRRERRLGDLPLATPRDMHIDVQRAGDRYAMTFAVASEHGPVVLRSATPMVADELESELMAIRELWREVALESPFADAVEVPAADAAEQLRRLSEAGRRLWTALFRRQSAGGLARVGELLRRQSLPVGATIQISIATDASTFVFPWGLLYDRPRPRANEPVDPQGFWGLRYILEQGVPGLLRAPDQPATESDRRCELAYMLWRRFRNAKDHGEMLAGLAAAAGGRLSVSTPPVMDADSCLDLLQHGESDILYFFTHGFTRRRDATLRAGEEIDRFRRRYDRLATDDPRRGGLRPLYDALADGPGVARSYIEFSYGRLYLDDLYDEIDPFLRPPLVLLNMCESAHISPSLSDSFVGFFLDRGATSVIGTECPMTVAFAHPFAEALLTRILAGERVGAAFLAVRRALLYGSANPLGLAYSLYGSATTRLAPPVLR